MSLFSKIRQKAFNELIDIIEWSDGTTDTMIWCFPRYQAEIKNGAQLIVRESQLAVLMYEGQFADVYQPGNHELTTNSMPILTTLKGWKYSFNSSFKADVYFVNTKQFLNIYWGTATPIMMKDSEFGSIRICAFGTYSFRIESDPIKFVRSVVGIDKNFTPDSVKEQLHDFTMTKFTDYLVESKIAVLDLATNLKEFSSELTIALKDDFSAYGIELTKFSIKKILLPANVEEALDKRTSNGLNDNMPTYIEKINPRNGKPLKDRPDEVHRHNDIGINPQQSGPPPMPSQKMYHVAFGGLQQGPFAMAQLQQMVQQGQLTPESLVWTAGMSSWAVAHSVPSVSQLFGVIPPSL